jgi:hypothetical protein
MRAKPSPSNSPLVRIDAAFVDHPTFTEAIQKVEFILSLHKLNVLMPNLHISGPSGIGKSTLIKKLECRFPRVTNGRHVVLRSGISVECDEIPLLCIDMPSTPTVISLAQAILKAMGDAHWDKGGQKSLDPRVDLYLEACGTHGIMIDNAQRAVDRRGVVVKQDLGNWLVARYDALNIPFFFVGLGRAKCLFDQDEQIDRRFDADHRMAPYRWGALSDSHGPQSRVTFIAILHALRQASGISWDPALDLNSNIVCLRFYYASRGVIGLLKKLLTAAVRVLLKDGGDNVDLMLLERAFSLAFRKERAEGTLDNPFEKNWSPRLPPELPDDTILINLPNLTRRQRNGKLRKADRALFTQLALTK